MQGHALTFSLGNARGIYPNYADKHDSDYGPLFDHAAVIKFVANQSYLASARRAALVSYLARPQGFFETKQQSYVAPKDKHFGRTIGPLSASSLGVKIIDIGVPTVATHSICEIVWTHSLSRLSGMAPIIY